MAKESTDEEMQMHYLELQVIDKHVKEIQQQIGSLDDQRIELAVIKQNILDLGKTKKGSKMLVPLNNGIFAEADLSDTESLLVNVGAGVVVKKSVEDTARMMDDQTIEITGMRTNLESTLQKLVTQAMEIEKKISGSEDV